VDGKEFSVGPCDAFAFPAVIDEICGMRWEAIGAAEVLQVAKAYYYFSIQFRENLEIACRIRPGDALLQKLSEGECDTDNLSPFPGVCAGGEKLNHDEFMRRLLAFQPIDRDHALTVLGEAYLDGVRALDDLPRAASIASYEDGGLSRVFAAMLRARDWHGAGPVAFRYFLEEHIRFDTDDDEGHGALSRHLPVDDSILPMWTAFRDLLLAAAPRLEQVPARELMPEAAD
jgi:hypothetical protein